MRTGSRRDIVYFLIIFPPKYDFARQKAVRNGTTGSQRRTGPCRAVSHVGIKIIIDYPKYIGKFRKEKKLQCVTPSAIKITLYYR